VITIGTFDGVHLGHQQILKQVVEQAKSVQGESIVISFEPHPRRLLFPDQPLKLLTSLKLKLDLLLQSGIQHVVVVPFTRDFSDLTATQYVEDFLVKKFNPHSIVIGYDHHFGHDRSGNISLLKELQNRFHYHLVEISAHLIHEASVSSTKIRNSLSNGKIEEANEMLGRHFSIKGIVVKGDQRGRILGFPTANIKLMEEDLLVPSNGVYAAKALWRGKELQGMMNIGFNPTFLSEKKQNIEVHLFDFNQEIYGEELEVLPVSFLREEQKFPSLEALKAQLAKDELRAKERLQNPRP
jgi:riboflavin kinase/FMN adenylyltransferase